MVNKANRKLLSDLFSYIKKKLQGKQADTLIKFSRQYYQSVFFDDLDKIVIEDLYGAVLSHWNLALTFNTEQKIRVYNPTLEDHGWQSKHTIVEIVVKDRPFLLQSLSMEVNRYGFTNHLVIHPVFSMKRDKKGQFIDFCGDTEEGGTNECLVHLEIDRQSDPMVITILQKSLNKVLIDVRASTEDWQLCLSKMQLVIDELKQSSHCSDEVAFLQWLHNNHFVFLAYREYQIINEPECLGIKVIKGSGLGVLRDSIAALPKPPLITMTADAYNVINTSEPLIITKATSKATVHRPVFMDYIGIKQYDKKGIVIGEKRFLGLYSSTAYSSHLSDIPMISTKIKKLQDIFGFTRGSHRARALLFILQSLPRDEVFQADFDSLFEFTEGMLHLQQRQRARVFIRQDVYGHFASLLIFVPRDRYHTETRKKIQSILLDVFKAKNIEFSVQLSESILARLHFIIHSEEGCCVDFDVQEIEEKIVQALANWDDGLKAELHEYHGEAKGNQLFNFYHEGFSAAYREEVSCRTALLDIEKIEYLIASDFSAESLLYSPLTAVEEKQLRFKLFSKGQASLSKSLPMLENMGVKVCDEHPYEISKKDCADRFWMHDFGLVVDIETKTLNVKQLKPRFEEAFEQCWFGKIENDGFNQLVLRAGLSWQEVNILRAYFLYLRQIGITFSQVYVETTLNNNPEVSRLLIHYFIQRFDPSLKQQENSSAELYATIEKAIDKVESLDEDRILRRYLNLIQAAVRTNYFRNPLDEKGIPYFSTKFDSSKIAGIPSPIPFFEIYVYSPRIEGIHLRGGAVARGGLRWSDRREDFRTEILGLMKAQMTKNAVIVPTGAKGGFIVKHLKSIQGSQQRSYEVVHCYQILIRGLLDLIDNRIADQIIKPENCVCYDGDDSYLVVAADKGTATFSDYANALSIEYGFWLGDAFASGGSVGYDHKMMGITARGAWESVKHHFNKLNFNYLEKPFTVIGIGGMMGDVFGNGMLLSNQIKLIASFDHEFIFLDPDPDPEKSFHERERLFVLPKCKWSDYDKKIISQGGGVYSRSLKSIALTPQVKQKLNIRSESLTPHQLIKAILRAPVDLLWNGGIGTYVKSSAEQNTDVGDRANDAVRINASELRCKQVGEGGNLGFTQSGRIEFAVHGGVINTDSIDNSAGVDCSDHEVNIKILVNSLVAQGDLTEKQRNRLLESMTKQVGELVLRHNYFQNRAITMIERNSFKQLNNVKWLISILEKKGNLYRELETIPQDDELQERAAKGLGLVRPEISVLLAYSKQLLKQELLFELDTLDKDLFLHELNHYFPIQLQEKFPAEIKKHCLAEEIVANRLVNNFVNRMGMVLAFRLMEETGCSIVSMFNVYKQICHIFDIETLWQDIGTQDFHLDDQVLGDLHQDIRKLIERAMYWFLSADNKLSNQDKELIESQRYIKGIAELKTMLPTFMSETVNQQTGEKVDAFVEKGVSADLALNVVTLDALYLCLDVVWLNKQSDNSLNDCAKVFFQLLRELDLLWLREKITALPEKTVWESLARKTAREEFGMVCCYLSLNVLKNEGATMPDKITNWLKASDKSIARYRKLLALVHSDDEIELEKITVLLKELRDICS
ncbi:MAG: NAD-glutamate dehydrogenase [Methylococcales bacterium]|nr:NAD-glutamate dehydrogenase [Methylococcales bacterium]